MSLANREVLTNGALLEKVITNNDLGGLTSLEKVSHIKNVCESLGLNPLTKPIQLIKFQGKEIAYFTKDATEQLRKTNNISIKLRDPKILEGIYIIVAEAKTSDGREDSSTGAITIAGLKGDALCNAMMKAETKAKRRVTLSICGLGFTDESEIETMQGAKKISINDTEQDLNVDAQDEMDFQDDLERLNNSKSLDGLELAFKSSYKHWIQKKDREKVRQIIEMKDKVKDKLVVTEFNEEIKAVEVLND